MNRHKFLDGLVVIGIFSLFILPLLIPFSYFPVVKFYSELFALLIAAVITLIVSYKVERVSISSAGIASLLFAVFLVAQIAVVHIRFPGINIVIALEFLVVGLFSAAITSYIDGQDATHQRLFIMIAWAVLIATTIQGIFGLLQYTHQAANFQSLILQVDISQSSIVGNVGQKNDYSDFLTLGVFALAYLFFIRQVNVFVFVLYEIFFFSVLTLCLSRTSFAYFVLAFIVTCIYTYLNRKHPERKAHVRQLFLLIAGLFVGLFVVEALLPHIISWLQPTPVAGAPVPQAVSGLARLGRAGLDNQATYRRFYEWCKDLVLFTQHPFFGVGWFQYPHEGIYIMNTDPRFMYIPGNTALYTHSHNSPLNVLAETGIVGFAITIIYGVFYSVARMFKNFDNYHTLFASFLILTIFTQSLFQYPLWYAYFLVYFVLFLSLDKPVVTVKNNLGIKIVVTLLFVAFAGFCWLNSQTYSRVVSYTAMPADADDFAANVTQLEGLVDHNMLWSLPALTVLDNYIMPTSPQTNAVMSLQDQEKYIDMLGGELPYAGEIFKQIIIHKVVGDQMGASYYAHLLAYAFPAMKSGFANQLASSPEFANEVGIINGFKYEDKSIFHAYFSKEKGGN